MYVSEVVKQAYRQREQKVLQLIKDSGISYIKVGVFGSYARQEYKSGSDIDFCIIVEEKPDHATSGWLREDADMLGADIVIVTETYFKEDQSEFARQLRRDFREVSP